MAFEETSSFDEAEQAAMSHAWDYFEFHAHQRQTVFNFFLILVGASIAAYVTLLTKAEGSHHLFHAVLGAIVALSSFLFWRLDKRNSQLVKLAEGSLKLFEERLSERSRVDIRMLQKADEEKETGLFVSFSQIYRFVFIVAGIGGLLVFAVAMFRLCR